MTGKLTPPPGWVPDFEGQRPPFAPGNDIGVQFQPGNTIGPRAAEGNELAVTHGAYSADKVEPIAAQLKADLLASDGAGFLSAPGWRFAVDAWAKTEARILLIERWLDQNAAAGLDDEGNVRPAMDLLLRWSKQAENARQRLGLDPLSRARLGKDLSTKQQADAATELTRMRAELEARQTDDEQGAP